MITITEKTVCHKKYGVGVIVSEPNENGNDRITVKFEDGVERRFMYPSSIGGFLETEDWELQEQAAKDTAVIEAAIEERKRLEIEAKEKQLQKTLASIDHEVMFSGPASRIFIVHQGDTYQAELEGGYLWAPQTGLFHHENMTKVLQGDIIFHYVNGGIKAVSEALEDCFNAKRPTELDGYGWDREGYEVIARYRELNPPLTEHP